jgi:hypothetical protein
LCAKPKDCAVKGPEDGLRKKASNGSPDPNRPLLQTCGDQVSFVLHGNCANGGSRNNWQSEPKIGRGEWFMKVKILGVVILAALILAVAFSASAPAAPNKANANAFPAAAPQPNATTAVPADHPEIHDALASLHHAKEHLEHAAHDFGGHRVEAIRAIDESIRQLEICLKYDR